MAKARNRGSRPSPLRVPAETFKPGEFIREELEYRGWEPGNLADMASLNLETVDSIIAGRMAIDEEISAALGEAFGVNEAFFYRLQQACDATGTVDGR